jgi:hypothetical protein
MATSVMTIGVVLGVGDPGGARPGHGAQPTVGFVERDASLRRPVELHPALADVDDPVAHCLDAEHVVRDEQDRRLALLQVLHEVDALALEGQIADRQHLVQQQDVRLQVSRDREGQPHVHAAGVPLHRCADEVADLGEGDDGVELARDLGFAHAQDRAVQKDVLASGQFAVKAGAHLQQATQAAVDESLAPGRLRHAGEDLQQRALARAVQAQDADVLTLADLEGDVVQRPELLSRRLRAVATPAAEDACHNVAQGVGPRLLGAQQILLTQAFGSDGDIAAAR